MKLILKEYLASLKERGELDQAVLPNLLSEVGLRVLNRPMIGTRQNGVDIAAVGNIKGETGEKSLYLFCIKAGNISRSDWNSGNQSVRAELEDIRDVYLRTNVADEYQDLPVKICLCCGGELEETVLTNWAGYTANNKTDKITYIEWNGDRLAELMMRCLLARELLESKIQRNFHKAIAMVNEPETCYEYTRELLNQLLDSEESSPRRKVFKLRQAFICLHVIVAWAKDANNLETSYKVCEAGLLLCWNFIREKSFPKTQSKNEQSLDSLFEQFFRLYLNSSDEFFEKTTYPFCNKLHALSAAVKSKEPVDVNLAMYELLGRLAIYGSWTHLLATELQGIEPQFKEKLIAQTNKTLNCLVELINNNPTLHSPVRDDHAIEIALVMYLAQLTNSEKRFLPWLQSVAHQTTFALISNSMYPTCFSDYSELIEHPKNKEQDYRDRACAGSILYPYLYFWLQRIDDDASIFTERLTEMLPNCTYQAWLPDSDSDGLLWKGETYHGICVTDIAPTKGFTSFIQTLNEAIKNCKALGEITAVKRGLIPLFLMACRHYRLPVPPNLWVVK